MVPRTVTASKRLLIVTPTRPRSEYALYPSLLKALTGTAPSEDAVFAGYTSHPPLHLATKYYDAHVSLWCDELPPPDGSTAKIVQEAGEKAATTVEIVLPEHDGNDDNDNDGDTGAAALTEIQSLEEWRLQMLSDEAKEVRMVIGGLLLALPYTPSMARDVEKEYLPFIETMHELKEAIEDDSYGQDVASIVLLQADPRAAVRQADMTKVTDKLEDICLSDKGMVGWDFIAWDGAELAPEQSATTNEFGEKVGLARVFDVLEPIDWTADSGSDVEIVEIDKFGGSGGDADPSLDAGTDAELHRAVAELRMSVLDGQRQDDDNNSGNESDDFEGFAADDEDEDLDVEARPEDDLDKIMQQVVAIRDAGAALPQDQRQKYAMREVSKIIKSLT